MSPTKTADLKRIGAYAEQTIALSSDLKQHNTLWIAPEAAGARG